MLHSPPFAPESPCTAEILEKLGDAHRTGVNGPKSPILAVQFYERCIQVGGGFSAVEKLTTMLDNGEGVEKDRDTAAALCADAVCLYHVEPDSTLQKALRLAEHGEEADVVEEVEKKIAPSGGELLWAFERDFDCDAYARDGVGEDFEQARERERGLLEDAVREAEKEYPIIRMARILLRSILLEDDERTEFFEEYPHGEEEVEECFKVVMSINDHIPGMCYLGYCFERGAAGQKWTRAENRVWARRIYEQDIKHSGCNVARLSLAILLEKGVTEDPSIVKRDKKRALELCEVVVHESGFNMAVRMLASLLSNLDMSMEENNNHRAANLYKIAICNGGSTDAMEALADLYAFNFSFEDVHNTSYKWQAAKLYEMAIRHSDHPKSSAMESLAMILEHGADGVPKNVSRAVDLYEEAAELGNDDAAYNLARILENGAPGVPADRQRAVDLYKEIPPGLQYDDIELRLATLISSGYGDVEEDVPYAIHLYENAIEKEAAEGGDCPVAKINLARLMVEGRANFLKKDGGKSLQRDGWMAIRLLENAIEEGSKSAKFDLAVALTSAFNGPIDLPRGMSLYEELIQNEEDIGAMANLSRLLYKEQHGIQNDISRAIQLCENAISIGFNHSSDLVRLGIIASGTRDIYLRSGSKSASVRNAPNEKVLEGLHLVAMGNLAEILLTSSTIRDVPRALLLLEGFSCDERFARLTRKAFVHLGDTLRALGQILTDISVSPSRALKVFKVCVLIAKNGKCTQAMRMLANVFMVGSEHIPKDERRAAAFFQHAIEQGDRKAMLALGDLLSIGGRDIGADRSYAFELFTRVISESSEKSLVTGGVVGLALLVTKHAKQHRPWNPDPA